jgi:RNA polymerase sigma factor (sigma-70 family)
MESMKAYTETETAPAPKLPEGEIARLVEDYLPLVLHQVDRAWLSPRIGLAREDLISAGCYGLLLAARRFDPSRGVGFGVFARSHVHGALMREIQTAMKGSGVGTDDVLIIGSDIEVDSLPDDKDTPTDSAETAQVRELLEYQLSERERLIVTLYFYEELTLAEIAEVTSESESTVSRTLKSAIDRLRTVMKAPREDSI